MALIIGKNAVYAADVLVGNSNKAIRIFYRAPHHQGAGGL